jgi:Undecaprenyl-phosphate glucose phosphotransferase
MLHRHSEIFRTLFQVSDVALVAASAAGAFAIRFGLLDTPQGVPDTRPYTLALLGVVPLTYWMLRARGLYQPQRTGSLLREAAAVVSAVTMSVVLLLAADAALRSFLSRGVIGLFWALASTSLVGSRLVARGLLRGLRRRGYNLRYVLVVGAGDLAGTAISAIQDQPQLGLRVVGALGSETPPRGRTLCGAPVLGSYGALAEVLAKRPVDEVWIALPREDAHHQEKILAGLDDTLVTVRLIPDLLHVMTLRCSVEDLEGLPLINLRQTPLVGWAAVQKRAFDVVVSGVLLVTLAPLLTAIALAIACTSGRPVLYVQERMGLDGRVFRLLKFRSMKLDAEQESGPVWTRQDDPRCTRLGGLLRRTSLDELPQLWNVLRGDMSLVGPRPERPVFIERFRREIPGYMLRHTVKAGLTGWAQVHGWRGNTSLHERIEHDIHYIQNWSLGLDVRILLMTLFRAARGAY